MSKVKLLGVLAILLIIASYGSFAAAQLSFPFPTPTPTPTPVPTTTPTPTPKPEPTTWPSMDIQCRSSAAENSLKIAITGTLSYNKTGIPNTPIYLGFSSDGGSKWENFTLVQTSPDGGYSASWIPNATGNYLVCAQWLGNDSLHWLNATVNLALTPDQAGNVFSVISNSTIINLSYDSATQTLGFGTNGTSKTTGYMYACIPKSLVSDIQGLQVNIDGKQVAFDSESQTDVWVVSCIYAQSEHAFSIQIPPAQVTLSPQTTPWVLIVVAVVVVIVVVAVLMAIRRRHRTAATVAAILKQDRPVY